MTSMATKALWVEKIQNQQSSRLAYGIDASRAAGARQQPTTFEIVPQQKQDDNTPTLLLIGLGLGIAYLWMK